ncbi:MAG: helix-turn-helix domain-containing protein [Oscillospiraceae bacterium]|nr:helix-turn-helix domain-containing protein [Oscillospiraceae bacterium]
MSFSSPKPSKDSAFGIYLDYYTQRAGISQNTLANCARVNQPWLNRLANGRIKDTSVAELVCLCLALRLNVDESKDLLARMARTFSPAEPMHGVYLELIKEYHKKEIDYKKVTEISEFLVDADNTLTSKGYPPLPSAERTPKEGSK